MSFKLSSKSKSRLVGVDSRWPEIIDLALTITLIDFGIPNYGGLRTSDDQLRLYLDGKSKCDGKTNISNHQLGTAVDFYAYVDGKASWDHFHLAHVACALFAAANQLGYKVHWGGFFKPGGWDKPHLELID